MEFQRTLQLKFHEQELISEYIESLLETSNTIYTPTYQLPQIDKSTYNSWFSNLPASQYPDLKYRSSAEVRKALSRIFSEIPSQFDPSFKNPCWIVKDTQQLSQNMKKPKIRRNKLHPAERDEFDLEDGQQLNGLTCLPYVYILGQPKAGTSDLWARLANHPHIHPPEKKEIRWFTRGEFTTTFRPSDVLDESTSIYDFTTKFSSALKYIRNDPSNSITVDGGPHTLWWPTQGADGVLRPDDIPPAQIIREMQPKAKFLITVADPIRRMYSDYYFLNDDRKVAKHSKSKSKTENQEFPNSEKSPLQFHQRVIQQVNDFHVCVENILEPKRLSVGQNSSSPHIHQFGSLISNITSKLANMFSSTEEVSFKVTPKIIQDWFRASQSCAHDRHKFGVAGYGRIGIGLYILFLEKWLEHFDPSQFLVVRLENYESNPREYMSQIFSFLNVSDPSEDRYWNTILTDHIANRHNYEREEMYIETREILKRFYRPYNIFLSLLLRNKDYLWDDVDELSTQHLPSISKLEADTPRHHEIPEVSHPIKRDDESYRDQSKMKTPIGNLRGKRIQQEELIQPSPRTIPPTLGPVPVDLQMNEFISSLFVLPLPERLALGKAFDMVCTATLGMDVAALKYLLYDYGIPPRIADTEKDGSSASFFHCLSAVGMFGDAISRSQVFPLLKGKKTWLTDKFDPPLPLTLLSVHSPDIKNSLSKAINSTFYWLYYAGVNISATDSNGNTPMHVAAAYGLESLVQLYLEYGADPNALNHQKKTPLHYAIAYGYGRIGFAMMKYGGNLTLRDIHNVTPMDIISNPGVISPSDALNYFSIKQSPVRAIERELHPHFPNSFWKGGGPVGNGGYDETRLDGFETDLSCDVDQYLAHEINGKQVFEQYFARNRPVLIRGLMNDWPAIEKYQLDRLNLDHGTESVQVSPIPYSTKFGGAGVIVMKLSEYISEMKSHNITGGKYPWYVFQGHPIRDHKTDTPSSLVYSKDVPTPAIIAEALHYVNMGPSYDTSYTISKGDLELLRTNRKDFINAQWALGGAGTGAPVHYHNTAWNALIYGAKKWILYPPSHMIMSNKQILDYFETDLIEFQQKGIHFATCVQTAGDILVVPESWGHGVLNIQDSIAVATESKGSMWRASVKVQAIQHLPDDNRKQSKEIGKGLDKFDGRDKK